MVDKTSKKTERGAKKGTRKTPNKSVRAEKTTKIKNSVRGKAKSVKWPVRMAWASYILMAIFMLILGPGALIIYAMAGGNEQLLQFLSYGLSGTAGVLSLIGLLIGAISAIQTYGKASDRMREVMTLVGGGVVALGISLLITVLLPFKAMESYVIMYTLLALLPGVLAAMFRWLIPARTERRNWQLGSLVVTMILLVVEMIGTAALVTTIIGSVINETNEADADFDYAQIVETPVDASESVGLPED